MSDIETRDVIVLGGGLMGAATAFFLAHEHGMRPILLERGFVGAQASGVNFGHVRRQGRYLPQLPLAHRSLAIWRRIPELLGGDCEFLASGSLKLGFDGAEMHKLERYAQEARQWGLALDVLGRAEVLARFPWLGPGVLGGTLSPEDGHANPRLAAPLFARAARRAGADVSEQCEVTSVLHDGNLFKVQTATGQAFAAPCLVNAAGAWGGAIAASFGEPVPLAAHGPLMGVTEPLPYFIGPVLGNGGGTIYLRQVERGNVVFGGGRRSLPQLAPPRASPIPGHLVVQWLALQRLVPSLAGAQVIRSWSGIEGYMDDMLPVLGPSLTTPGLFHCFGFCGHGFQLGPGVGAVVAEFVASGQSSTPIAPFSVGRFLAPGDARRTHVAQAHQSDED